MSLNSNENILDWMIKNETLEEDEKELYKYALTSVALFILPIIMALIIGGLLGSIRNGIMVAGSFLILRKFCGGYHLKSFKTCFICSTIILVTCIHASLQLKCYTTLLRLDFLFLISMSILSPIENGNRSMDDADRADCKKITQFLSSIIMILVLVFEIINYHSGLVSVSLGMILVGTLQWIALIKRYIDINLKK